MAEMNDEEARAALDASSKLYYRIGEVSKLTGVKAHVLRYWETEFRWMAPPKSRSKQRLYRKRDIEFVWLLKRLLWDERYTIAGARQRIQDLGVDESLALLRDASPRKKGSHAQVDAEIRSRGKNPNGHVEAAKDDQNGARSASSSASAVESGTEFEANTDALPEARRAEWVAFGAALGDLHAELSTLRGALQEGL
jgi:DNA-binding transcriptional MerR regulator